MDKLRDGKIVAFRNEYTYANGERWLYLEPAELKDSVLGFDVDWRIGVPPYIQAAVRPDYFLHKRLFPVLVNDTELDGHFLVMNEAKLQKVFKHLMQDASWKLYPNL